MLLDIRSPDMDAWELIRFIRRNEHNRGAALVVLSSCSSERERERASTLGAHACIARPSPPEVMTATLLRALASQQARRCIA